MKLRFAETTAQQNLQ